MKTIDAFKVRAVLNVVTSTTGVSETALKEYSKYPDEVKARRFCYWLLWKHGSRSTSAVARVLNRKHNCAHKAINYLNTRIAEDAVLQNELLLLSEKVRSRINHPFNQQNAKLQNFTMKALLEQKVNKHLTAA
jgi:chromosomal replication initiation ATPase DnaA